MLVYNDVTNNIIIKKGSYPIPEDDEHNIGKLSVGVPTVVNNIDKNININGVYNVPSGYSGYGTVTVQVPQNNISYNYTLEDNKYYEVRNNGEYEVFPDSGNDGMRKVTLDVKVDTKLQEYILSIDKNTTNSIILSPESGYDGFSRISYQVNVQPKLEECVLNIDSNTENTEILMPSSGYDGFSRVSYNVNVPKYELDLIEDEQLDIRNNENSVISAPEGKAFKSINLNIDVSEIQPYEGKIKLGEVMLEYDEGENDTRFKFCDFEISSNKEMVIFDKSTQFIIYFYERLSGDCYDYFICFDDTYLNFLINSDNVDGDLYYKVISKTNLKSVYLLDLKGSILNCITQFFDDMYIFRFSRSCFIFNDNCMVNDIDNDDVPIYLDFIGDNDGNFYYNYVVWGDNFVQNLTGKEGLVFMVKSEGTVLQVMYVKENSEIDERLFDYVYYVVFFECELESFSFNGEFCFYSVGLYSGNENWNKRFLILSTDINKYYVNIGNMVKFRRKVELLKYRVNIDEVVNRYFDGYKNISNASNMEIISQYEVNNEGNFIKVMDFGSDLCIINLNNYIENGNKFSDCLSYNYYLKYIKKIYNLNTGITDLTSLFNHSNKIINIPFFDTGNISIMNEMFLDCGSLVDVPEYDTSNVVRMVRMFCGCKSLKSFPVLNTSKVTSMNSMFERCCRLSGYYKNYDTSSVIYMKEMFRSCYSISLINMGDLKLVEDMSYICCDCFSLEEFSIEVLPESLEDISYMFKNCFKLIRIPCLNTFNLIEMKGMCLNCISLNENSLNNILIMCKNSSVRDYNRSLRSYIGISSIYSDELIQGLNNYSDFVGAGWTI